MNDVFVDAGPPLIPIDEIVRRIRTYLVRTDVIRAILFGSFGRGEADAASDVDLLLGEPTPLPFVERGRRHLPLFRIGIGLDLLIYTPEEFERLKSEANPLIERACREGVTIYARSES